MKVLVPLVGRANSKVLFHFPPTLNRCPPVFMHSSRLIAMLSVALMSLVDAAPAPAVVKPVIPPSRLVNFSVRAHAGSDDDALIVGFTIAGPGCKQMLVRGIGPALARFGVTDFVSDPRIRIYNGRGGRVNQNDNWTNDPAVELATRLLGAFPLPENSRDAALLPVLSADNFTVRLSSAPPFLGGTARPGIGLLEVYDSDTGMSAATLVNFSARTRIDTLGGGLTAGFCISGDRPKTVLIRGIGPSLTGFAIGEAASSVQLALFNMRDEAMAVNSEWSGNAALEASFARTGAFRLNAAAKDAAILVTLLPGLYTIQLVNTGSEPGMAMIELYTEP
jgi:hypothetical protein